MHRFYSNCCYHPLYNTVDFLGFVGVFLDIMVDKDAVEKYDGPVYMFENEAYKDPTKRTCSSSTTTTTTTTIVNTDGGDSSKTKKSLLHKPIFVPHFLWKLIRYHPYKNCGSKTYLNYNQKDVVYWGNSNSTNTNDDGVERRKEE